MGSAKAKVFPQVRWLVSAPGRIRTRDPLLRRQLLCPAELRAPEDNCAGRRSRHGHTKVAVCRPLKPHHLGKLRAIDPEDPPSARGYLNLPSAVEPRT